MIGGQATDTIPLLYHLKELYDIRVLYGKKEADEIAPLFLLDIYPGLQLTEIPYLQRTLNPYTDLVAFFKLLRFIKAFNPHIVHTHGAKSGILGRLAAYFCRTPAIVHTFHGHVFHSYFNRLATKAVVFAERLLASVTDAAIALSNSQKEEITHKFNVFPEKKVYVIPLGIEMPMHSGSSRSWFRNKYGLAENHVAIAIIGRIVPIKNHSEFLKIARNIFNMGNKNCVFFIIGDGHVTPVLYNYLKENDIVFSTPDSHNSNSKVIFTSWLSDIAGVIAGLDIIALTSHNEGTPVSLIEAQLGARPVVAYNVGGVADTFKNKVSGYLVAKGDRDDFTKKLQCLINDAQMRNNMGEQGKLYCSQKFSKRSEVNATDDLYKSLLAKKKPAQI